MNFTQSSELLWSIFFLIFKDLDNLRDDGTSTIQTANFETGTSGWNVLMQSTGGNIAVTTATFTKGTQAAVLSSEIVVTTTFSIPAG